MNSLGARLRALETEMRLQHLALREKRQGCFAPFIATARELKAAETVWNSAKRRTLGLVRMGAGPCLALTLGQLSYGVPPTRLGDVAFAAFVRSCLPLTVPNGLVDERNVFHSGWKQFSSWAFSEELYPEMVLEPDSAFVETKLVLRLRPLPNFQA